MRRAKQSLAQLFTAAQIFNMVQNFYTPIFVVQDFIAQDADLREVFLVPTCTVSHTWIWKVKSVSKGEHL